MEFETVKTVAAFGGLGLGVVNLGLSIYKDFIRKPSLRVEIDSAYIRSRGPGEYDFQIQFSLEAVKGNVYLKEIEVRHPAEVFGPYNPKNKLVLNRISQHTRQNLLDLDGDAYKDAVIEAMKAAYLVRDLELKGGQRRSFTITDRFQSERLSDGWLEVPLTSWSLEIDYGANKETIQFQLNPIKRMHQNFENGTHNQAYQHASAGGGRTLASSRLCTRR